MRIRGIVTSPLPDHTDWMYNWLCRYWPLGSQEEKTLMEKNDWYNSHISIQSLGHPIIIDVLKNQMKRAKKWKHVKILMRSLPDLH